MRYVLATVTAGLLLFAGIALGGAGQGWVTGAIGSFAFAPIGFVAVTNGLSSTPSYRVALSVLAVCLAVCLGVAVATIAQGGDQLSSYFQATSPAGPLIACAAYFGCLLITGLALVRARRDK